MTRDWSFGRKIGAGLAVTVGLAALVAVIGVYALRTVVEAKDRVIAVHASNLIDANDLEAAANGVAASVRGFLLDKKESFLEQQREHQRDASDALGRLRGRVQSDDDRRLLDRVERSYLDYGDAAEKAVGARKSEATSEGALKIFEEVVTPSRNAVKRDVQALVSRQETQLVDARQASTDTATTSIAALVATAAIAVIFGGVVAFGLTRALGRQIGGAVTHIQSSSAELQSAASQQATGAKEQTTAMNEITTTISELLATSRQIAESAQRIAQIAEQTATAARSGDTTVQRGQDSVSGMRRQIDLVVTHMLDLGRKSQQIGGIVEIITELAEQTNILAINAGIEAAGAGDAGRRFGVVADEIRKLADRVGGSTKEIRTLIDETRAAVNTTVMATESGQKSVESGAKQFGEVATAFRQIADLVRTSTEAAREIELSTKQQASAVQQVNAAIADVAQSTRETEASTNQTLQTATQLTTLSRDLTRFVQPEAA